jgi:hypothetical protein
MPEITVDIIWANKRRVEQHESLVDIRLDGTLIMGGLLISSNTELTDDQIVDLAIERLWPQEVVE